MSDMFAEVKNNDLGSFKSYVDSHSGEFEPYVNAIQYSYGVTPLVYETDTSSGIQAAQPVGDGLRPCRAASRARR
jgi:hypothetical protein